MDHSLKAIKKGGLMESVFIVICGTFGLWLLVGRVLFHRTGREFLSGDRLLQSLGSDLRRWRHDREAILLTRAKSKKKLFAKLDSMIERLGR